MTLSSYPHPQSCPATCSAMTDRLSGTLQEARPHGDGNLTEPQAFAYKLTLHLWSQELLTSSCLAQFESTLETLISCEEGLLGINFRGITLAFQLLFFKNQGNCELHDMFQVSCQAGGQSRGKWNTVENSHNIHLLIHSFMYWVRYSWGTVLDPGDNNSKSIGKSSHLPGTDILLEKQVAVSNINELPPFRVSDRNTAMREMKLAKQDRDLTETLRGGGQFAETWLKLEFLSDNSICFLRVPNRWNDRAQCFVCLIICFCPELGFLWKFPPQSHRPSSGFAAEAWPGGLCLCI